MRMRHAAVVAGLALGLMSGAANASAIYKVDFSIGSILVTGTVTANGKFGRLVTSDFEDFQIDSEGRHSDNSNSFLISDSRSDSGALATTDGKIVFDFNNIGKYVDFSVFNNDSGGYVFQFFQSKGLTVFRQTTPGFDQVNVSPGEEVLVGTLVPSTVPLPASAPMFGAAILALGAVGFGVKRKKAAASA